MLNEAASKNPFNAQDDTFNSLPGGIGNDVNSALGQENATSMGTNPEFSQFDAFVSSEQFKGSDAAEYLLLPGVNAQELEVPRQDKRLENLSSNAIDPLTGDSLANSRLNLEDHSFLVQAKHQAIDILQDFSKQDDVDSKLELVFGENSDSDIAQQIINQVAETGLSALPSVEIHSRIAMEGADGAFSDETQTLYLAQEFLQENVTNPTVVTEVLLEEFGHFLDSRINTADSIGDEGELFAKVLTTEVSLSEVAAIRLEDDHSTVLIDEQLIAVETSSTTNYPGYEFQYRAGEASTYDRNVEVWQQRMQDLGWTLEVDGFYEAESKGVAEDFQELYPALEDDGIVGTGTWTASFANDALGPGDSSSPDLPIGADSDPLFPQYSGQMTVSSELTPNMRAFLDTIAFAEGTFIPDGYRTQFTFEKFEDFDDHPREVFSSGGLDSSAAGRYQFLKGTWDGVSSQLDLTDFSPESQDLGAVELIDGRDALADVEAGRIREAIEKVSYEWASFPPGRYGQPNKSYDNLLSFYQQQLNIYS